MIDSGLQVGSIVGGIAGWASLRRGSMSRPAASLALPIGVFLLVLGWWNYSQIGIAFNVLGGAALAYGASPHLDRLFRAPATRGRDQR